MDDNKYLFSQKWKNILVVIFVMSLSFLDKVIPPLGIPIAIIAIFILFKWKKIPIKYLGIFRPQSWLKTISIGLLVGVFIHVFETYVLSSILEGLGIAQETPDSYATVEGNTSKLIIYLVVSWTTAGFGEEIISRSFFLGQFSSIFENEKNKWIEKNKWLLSLAISSLIFGLLHFNNGTDAIIVTAINGFILGLVYLKTNRNIWAAYIAHAVANTIGFLIIYLGFY